LFQGRILSFVQPAASHPTLLPIKVMQDTVRFLHSDTLYVLLSKHSGEWLYSPEWWALFIAVVILISNTMTQIHLANKRIKVEVIAKTKQKWIDDFRDRMSEFLGAVTGFAVKVKTSHISENEYHARQGEILLLEKRIHLLTSSTDRNQLELLILLADLFMFINQPKPEDVEIDSLVRITEKTAHLAIKICEAEVNKVQNLQK